MESITIKIENVEREFRVERVYPKSKIYDYSKNYLDELDIKMYKTDKGSFIYMKNESFFIMPFEYAIVSLLEKDLKRSQL